MFLVIHLINLADHKILQLNLTRFLMVVQSIAASFLNFKLIHNILQLNTQHRKFWNKYYLNL